MELTYIGLENISNFGSTAYYIGKQLGRGTGRETGQGFGLTLLAVFDFFRGNKVVAP